MLFSCLSPKDLYNYSRANRQAYEDVKSFRKRAFSIYKLLSPFFTKDEMEQFRVVQAETGTLISGSTALQFFNRLSYPDESDLKLYVKHRSCEEVGRFLRGIGYRFVAGKKQNSSFHKAIRDSANAHSDLRGIDGTFKFERASVDGDLGKSRIQLITTRDSPMDVILQFHATYIMNVISYSHAYSLYPYATFENSESLRMCQSRLPHQEYVERGWTMISGLGESNDFISDFISSTSHLPYIRRTVRPEKYSLDRFHLDKRRYVGDEYCWIIALPPIASLSAQSLSLTSMTDSDEDDEGGEGGKDGEDGEDGEDDVDWSISRQERRPLSELPPSFFEILQYHWDLRPGSLFASDDKPGLYALETEHSSRVREANSWSSWTIWIVKPTKCELRNGYSDVYPTGSTLTEFVDEQLLNRGVDYDLDYDYRRLKGSRSPSWA